MQRSRLISLAVMIAIITAGTIAQGQQPASPPGTASVTFGDGKTVTIDYSRPSMRGRQIFGGLVAYGEPWRTGANSATSLKTNVDLTIGGAAVPAGSYTLFTIPNENSWKLIINKQTGQWGTAYDPKQDLARVDMKVTQLPAAMEVFTIAVDRTGADSATLKLQWETTLASVDLKEAK